LTTTARYSFTKDLYFAAIETTLKSSKVIGGHCVAVISFSEMVMFCISVEKANILISPRSGNKYESTTDQELAEAVAYVPGRR